MPSVRALLRARTSVAVASGRSETSSCSARRERVMKLVGEHRVRSALSRTCSRSTTIAAGSTRTRHRETARRRREAAAFLSAVPGGRNRSSDASACSTGSRLRDRVAICRELAAVGVHAGEMLDCCGSGRSATSRDCRTSRGAKAAARSRGPIRVRAHAGCTDRAYTSLERAEPRCPENDDWLASHQGVDGARLRRCVRARAAMPAVAPCVRARRRCGPNATSRRAAAARRTGADTAMSTAVGRGASRADRRALDRSTAGRRGHSRGTVVLRVQRIPF